MNFTANQIEISDSNSMKSIFHFLTFLLFGVHCAWADYSDRMKARLAEVIAAKDAGIVGEGVDGFLHIRNSIDRSAKQMVNDENSDRTLLFEALSSKTGGNITEVAKKFASGIASKAKKGHWFRKSTGIWIKK